MASNVPVSRSEWCRKKKAPTMMTTPIGTFTNSTHRQLK